MQYHFTEYRLAILYFTFPFRPLRKPKKLKRCDPIYPRTPRSGAMGVRQCSARSAALKKRCDHDGAARLVHYMETMSIIWVSIHYMGKFNHYRSLLEKFSQVIFSYFHDISDKIRQKSIIWLYFMTFGPPPVHYMGESIIWESPLYGKSTSA